MTEAAEIPDNAPPQAPYALMGGEAAVRRVVERFYDIMHSDPGAADIRAMHAADLAPMREALFAFMSGWLGGPALYAGRPDAKCLRSAHLPYAIGAAERDQWLMCMRRALEDAGIDPAVRAMIDRPLFAAANFVRTR
jgi:hemoglobin